MKIGSVPAGAGSCCASLKNAVGGDSKDHIGICDPASIHFEAGMRIALVHRKSSHLLTISGRDGRDFGFEGEMIDGELQAPLSARNAAALRMLFPWCAPKSLRHERMTIGCGDRLGLASAGHIAAARKFKVSPVLAQQSMRELSLTNRTFQNVVDDATFAVFACDYRSGYGADGDHLKTIADIDMALAAGMPMITLDLSDVLNPAAGDWSDAEIDAAFRTLPEETRTRIDRMDAGLSGGGIGIDPLTARRCAVMYDRALDFAAEVQRHLQKKRGGEFDLEISIDETTSPTLPEHHLFIARELHRRGVEFSSLAPRFIGEFQKAIDYIGDLAEFDRQFKIHALIARCHGNYKISVHSGSDKFTVYPTVGRETRHYLHLKTAGTSWLVAVTVIARHDPALYRAMHTCALANFNAMLKLYHITADITNIPALNTLGDAELPKLMEMPEARQLLHINYGPILCGELRERFFATMYKLELEYDKAVEAHFAKHLSLLDVPLK